MAKRTLTVETTDPSSVGAAIISLLADALSVRQKSPATRPSRVPDSATLDKDVKAISDFLVNKPQGCRANTIIDTLSMGRKRWAVARDVLVYQGSVEEIPPTAECKYVLYRAIKEPSND